MSIEENERKLQSHDPCHAQCVLFMYYAALYVLVLTLRNLRINLMYAYFIFFYLMMMEAKCTQKTMAWPTVGQIPQKCKETSNLMWFSLIWFILVLFVCWKLFCSESIVWLQPKMFLFRSTKILNQAFRHNSHIWLWGFFTFLVVLAHILPDGKKINLKTYVCIVCMIVIVQ